MADKVKFSELPVGESFVCEDEVEGEIAFTKIRPGELSRIPDCNARRLYDWHMYRIIRSDELVEPISTQS